MRIDMTGFKNDLIEVIRLHGLGDRGKGLWLCKCKCGKEIIRTAWEIKASHPKSCGCYIQARHGNKNHHEYHTKHGFANKHSLYRVWKNIKQRCYNPNNQDYKNYGFKRIALWYRWKNDAGAFIRWCLRNGWKEGLTIDRINPNRGYIPDNCQFMTASENSKKMMHDNPLLNRGSNHRDAKITEETVREIRKMLKEGYRQLDVRKKFNISHHMAYQIANYKTWKHVG